VSVLQKRQARFSLPSFRVYSFKQQGIKPLVVRPPLFLSPATCGFPSPAEDFVERNLSLDEHLIHHPATTFFMTVVGSSMTDCGIHSGDLLIVDRSLEPANGQVVVAYLNQEFTVKRFKRSKGGRMYLVAENPDFQPIEITGEMEFQVWGVVTATIHQF